MKKTLFAALALVSMASCSNEEVLEVAQKEAIGFENAFVNNSTRSAYDPSITIDGDNELADFAVYAYVENNILFNGTTVDKTTKNNDLTNTETVWKYAGTQYWIAGAKYNFHAIAPKTGANWTVGENGATRNNVTVSFNNDGNQDLLYAKTDEIEGQASGNGLVGFTFNHALSKVKFSFKNNYDASNAKIMIKDVKILDAYATGTAVFTKNVTWNATSDNATLDLDFGHAIANDGEANNAFASSFGDEIETYKELLLIPYPIADGYKVQFKVELYIGETTTPVRIYTHNVTIPAAKFTPVAGSAYDIMAVIAPENIDPEHTQQPIEFTVTRIDDWGNTNNIDDILKK